MELIQNAKNKLYELIKTIVIFVPILFCVRTFLFGLYQVPTGSMETTMLIGERFVADKLTIWFRAPQRGDIITFNDAWTFTYSQNAAIRLFQNYVWGPSNWTKRVIGVPGDHVQGVIEDGKPVLYINGEKLDEPYVNKYPLIAVYKDGGKTYDGDAYHFRSYDPAYSFEEQPFYRMNKYNVEYAQQLFERMGRVCVYEPGTPVQFRQGAKSPDEFDVHLGPTEYWVMGDNRLGSSDSRIHGPLDGSYIHGKIVFRLLSIDSYESWWILDLIKHPIDFWQRIRWSRFLQVVH